MRARTLAVVGLVVVVAGGLVVAALVAPSQAGMDLETTWVSDTARETASNHHAPTAGRVQGRGMVYAPVSGRSNTPNCGLVALDGATGEERWTHTIPARNCTIHSVADPTLSDFDGDGVSEVIATTTERTVTARHPLTGEVEFRHNLTSYGYTKPVVADVTGDERPELVVVDVRGTVFVLRPDGTEAWSKRLPSYVWAQPAVADFDGDGDPEVAVATGGTGTLHVIDGNGSTARTWSFDDSISWMTTGQADGDAAVEIAVATSSKGLVSMVDAGTGTREWTRSFGRYAAVYAFGDGDSDGQTEVYAVAKDATLRSVTAATGEVEWTTTLTTADVQMTPPPAMGDVDGDGSPEVVAVTNDGVVSVVAPETGAVVASYEREVAIYAHPRLADIDGDGDDEVVVMYADARVVALDGTDSGRF